MNVVSGVLVLVLLVAACNDAPVDDAASWGVPDIPQLGLQVDFEGTWSQAWNVPPDLQADLEAALRSSEVWALIPTEAPPTGPALTAEVGIIHSTAAKQPAVTMVLRRGDQSVFVSVQATPIGDPPACDARLDDLFYPAWATQVIRGATGCSLLVDGAISFLEWTEGGQDFHVEFGPGVDVDELVVWFATWLPVATA